MTLPMPTTQKCTWPSIERYIQPVSQPPARTMPMPKRMPPMIAFGPIQKIFGATPRRIAAKVPMQAAAMPSRMPKAARVRPVVQRSRAALVKQICARSIRPPNSRPNRQAMPSTSDTSKRQAANSAASASTARPRRACRRARRARLSALGRALAVAPTFSGVRRNGSRLIFTPIQAPPTVANMKAQACRENIGIPVKNAARLQPIARRAPKPATIPPTRPCSRRRLLVGQRRLTLPAQRAQHRAPRNMPMIITPSIRSSGVP
ncbi:hypothetical protein PAERUG_P2_London_28_IMP_1_06_05_00613 [Pseudomonas aeruginosa]|nr:hypothetical protein PAERUG_P2_London_28_IMP_1_06_05_00613 [Pseudomonas aeruginosa]